MSDSTLAFFGISAAVLNTIGLAPYLRDIFRGKTKPERATWWVWFALNTIAFFAQDAAGSRWSLVFTAAQTLAVGAIAFLSLKFGYGKFQRRDAISLVIAAIGIILSLILSSPLLALIAVVGVDFAGLWLTLVKTWEAPETETLSAWGFASAAGLLAVLSVGHINLSQLIYPIYIFIADTIQLVLIIGRRKKTS